MRDSSLVSVTIYISCKPEIRRRNFTKVKFIKVGSSLLFNVIYLNLTRPLNAYLLSLSFTFD